jgi:GNAT superfamily N-acetyltransferase
MNGLDWEESFAFAKLEDGPVFGFDCGRSEQNEFFHERAWQDQQDSLSTTYVFYVHGLVAAYATITMDSLPLGRGERGSIPYRNVSSLKLAQLGVDRPFQGMGIGQGVVSVVYHIARQVGERVACRYVTLDAEPDLVPWYESQGFARNRLRQQERVDDAVRHRRDPTLIPVSMRFDLRSE